MRYKEDANVILEGNELCAIEGSVGQFVVVYSRFDEITAKRELLAYEVVNVMEPMQTRIDVKVGDQLKPIGRSFDTEELFPSVTRGLVDEADAGEIYVYQHMSGEQKNWLWAIRESWENPWKIEVFWRAKEELDVLWPFEVDIYAAQWDKAGAQRYLRELENPAASATQGATKAEPQVYVPGGLAMTVMDYQTPKQHMVAQDGLLYSTYAAEDAYSLVRFSNGERVWFLTVNSVASTDKKTLDKLGMLPHHAMTNAAMWTASSPVPAYRPFVPPYDQPNATEPGYGQPGWRGDELTRAEVAKEIRAPFAGEDGFFYPGWIQSSADLGWQIKNPYHPELYAYPREYTATNKLKSAIWPVNAGGLTVWWSLPCTLNGEVRKGSGHVAKIETPIFFPSIPETFTIGYPRDRYDSPVPQIVIASGLGSAGLTLNDHPEGTIEGYENFVPMPTRDAVVLVDGQMSTTRPEGTVMGHPEIKFSVDAGDAQSLNAFTVESFITLRSTRAGTNEDGSCNYQHAENGTPIPSPWIRSDGNPRKIADILARCKEIGYDTKWEFGKSMNPSPNSSTILPIKWVEASCNGKTYTIKLDEFWNLYICDEKITDFGPDKLAPQVYNLREKIWVSRREKFIDYRNSNQPLAHVALSRTAEGEYCYMVNGVEVKRFRIAGEGADLGLAMGIGGTEFKLLPEKFEDLQPMAFKNFRLWKCARSVKDIDTNRYTDFGADIAGEAERMDAPAMRAAYPDLLVQFSQQRTKETDSSEDNVNYFAPVFLEIARYHAFELQDGGRLHSSAGYSVECTNSVPESVGSGTELMGSYLPMTAMPGKSFGGTPSKIYRQNDKNLPGYNPNEEHALIINGVVYALRTDINRWGGEEDAKKNSGLDYTSEPFTIVEYVDQDDQRTKLAAFRIVPENDLYRFRTHMEAAQMFQSPAPLSLMQPANMQTFVSGPEWADTGKCFEDRKGRMWAHQAGDDGGATNYVFSFEYPNQAGFDYPGGEAPAVGARTVFMPDSTYTGEKYVFPEFTPSDSWIHLADTYHFPPRAESDKDGIDYTYVVSWPEKVPGLYVADTLADAKDGLPAVRGQLSVKVAYEQSVATGGTASVQLIDPTRAAKTSLPVIPEGIKWHRNAKDGNAYFDQLPPVVRNRLFWNPTASYVGVDVSQNEEFQLKGSYLERSGYSYFLLNVLDGKMAEYMKDPTLVAGAEDSKWIAAVDNLAGRGPVVLPDDVTPFDSIALSTTGKGSGYVTLVMNDSTNEDMVPRSESVFMYVIKVVPELYKGDLDPIYPENPLDKLLNLKYAADFGGKPQEWEFQWTYANPENGRAPDALDDTKWLELRDPKGEAFTDYATIGDAGVFGLSDHYVRCRYRPLDSEIKAVVGEGWSDWTAPRLAEGWVKRVLKAINPFEQRIRDYFNREIDTSLSMVQQAGAPYQGDVPMNVEALDENGLFQIYETLLNQAKKLSVDADNQGIVQDNLALALQMASGRLNELYTVLGNEALADALNPTVDMGKDAGVDDTAATSAFPFQNQCATILEEELALLRGRDLSKEYARSWKENNEPWVYPVFNRLPWNFTQDIMGGQVAYQMNYGIRDVTGRKDGTLSAEAEHKPDGSITAEDAEALYPQGHGDAYGHYLGALKCYYFLLRHPNFSWIPQVESILSGSTEVTISYLHEKRFAQAAAAKAKVAEMVVRDTYRQNYKFGDEDSWLVSETDDDEDVARWGTGEWATRGHLGAYYDWLTVNSLLPARNATEQGIRMIDRESTFELGDLAAHAKNIQKQADYADRGMNPLGLADAAVPFDISPTEIDGGKTHYEQIRERAQRSVGVAREIFKRAKASANALRDQNADGDLDKMIETEEAAINRELIAIYGMPYDDDIGPGKTYPQGYQGPDLIHYNYVDTYDLTDRLKIHGRYFDVTNMNYQLVITNVTGTYQAEIDHSLTDYGLVGNVIAGAITWYQDTLDKICGYINPWMQYGGVTNATGYAALPVSIVGTDGDHQDGAVDYDFSVAAWTNSPIVYSYYVNDYGFPTKPPTYTGQRKCEGEYQIALTDYAERLMEIQKAASELEKAVDKLRAEIDELHALDMSKQMEMVQATAAKEVEAFNEAAEANAKTIEEVIGYAKELKNQITDAGVESLPKITGLSFDLSSIGRGALKMVQSGITELLNGQIADQKKVEAKVKSAAEKLIEQMESEMSSYRNNKERLEKINKIKEAAQNISTYVANLGVTYNNANAIRMKASAVLMKGDQLQIERERLRMNWAAELNAKRYRNMMYQVMRNDELQRYAEAYDSAMKYVFLAAKAYDYETGLLESDAKNAAGRQFMTEIIRASSLGRFADDSTPLAGAAAGDPGLADILYRMDRNWDVLKTRLGFNNAQGDTDTFSLRTELFGKAPRAEGKAAWKSILQDCWTDDLAKHPAFANNCQDLVPMREKEPGFVIPFSTTIQLRKNFFGNDLKPGETAFSSSYFATKIRSVGVWLEGADAGSRLARRPEVYLVPAGLDYMRVPVRSSSSRQTQIRAWQVLDQVLPIPYPFSAAQYETDDWSVAQNTLGGEMGIMRKHPAIRASVGPQFDPNAMTSNARLIGRSVWNDKWYLIIPAGSLNANDESARQAVLDTVEDIKLNIRSYSLSGN